MIPTLLLAANLLTGVPAIYDADTFKLGRQPVRLWGVDSPEIGQTCTKPGAVYTLTYDCGREARDALVAWIAGRSVTCEPRGKSWGRVVARCEVAGQDIGAWLVASGWAWAATKFSGAEYLDEEAAARGAMLGIWQGDAVPAWEWRK